MVESMYIKIIPDVCPQKQLWPVEVFQLLINCRCLFAGKCGNCSLARIIVTREVTVSSVNMIGDGDYNPLLEENLSRIAHSYGMIPGMLKWMVGIDKHRLKSASVIKFELSPLENHYWHRSMIFEYSYDPRSVYWTSHVYHVFGNCSGYDRCECDDNKKYDPKAVIPRNSKFYMLLYSLILQIGADEAWKKLAGKVKGEC